MPAKKEPWYKTLAAKIGLVACIIGLFSTLGYNFITPNMPMTRAEGAELVESATTPLIEQIAVLTEDVSINTQDRKWQRFKYLMYKSETEGLTFNEQRELCALAAELNLQAPGCA